MILYEIEPPNPLEEQGMLARVIKEYGNLITYLTQVLFALHITDINHGLLF